MSLLIVGLTPTLARALAHGEQTRDTLQLRDLQLTPQRSRSLEDDDPDPVVWYSTETDDAEALSAQLLEIDGVAAAYVTPPQGPP